MPWSDRGNYPFETFLDFAEHGVWLWETKESVRRLPEEIFLNYVLYHRVNEEEIRPCRRLFYDCMKEQLDGLEGGEAAIEVNYWCAAEATYQSTDDRTLSALAVWQRGSGRCGKNPRSRSTPCEVPESRRVRSMPPSGLIVMTIMRG